VSGQEEEDRRESRGSGSPRATNLSGASTGLQSFDDGLIELATSRAGEKKRGRGRGSLAIYSRLLSCGRG
jgi:hypothetical protein